MAGGAYTAQGSPSHAARAWIRVLNPWLGASGHPDPLAELLRTRTRRSHDGQEDGPLDGIPQLRLTRWHRSQPELPEKIVGSVHVRLLTALELEVHAERNGRRAAVLHPVRCVHGDVHALAGYELVDIRAVLELRLVEIGVVVDGPVPLELHFGKHGAVGPVEDADRLGAADMDQEVALSIDVV